ncbi:MAG: GTP 3',8-cyclase MoaA [Pseudomonadota bacterium]
MEQPLLDSFGRKIDYLRVSLTESCNFHCVYCAPTEKVTLAPPRELLASDELIRLLRIFARLGIRRVRLTGGEPLLRRDIVSLVRTLRGFSKFEDIALTTNGSFLASLAEPLERAGLSAVNVSLDSLNRERFARITGRDRLKEVMAGIDRAVAMSLRVKINVMALMDLSREEVLEFCRMAFERPISVRFLEFMPLCGEGWTPDRMLPIGTVRRWISNEYPLRRQHRGPHAAETFAIDGARGTVGFIASLTEPFCEACNRLRLTATGRVHLCLFSPLEFDLRAAVRDGSGDEEIESQIRRAVLQKPRERSAFSEWKKGQDPLPRIRVLGG